VNHDAPPSAQRIGADIPDLLVVTPHRRGRRAVIEIAGELDLDGQGLLLSAAESALDQPPPPIRLDIDADGVEFMDSSGLAALLRIREKAELAEVTFHVTRASSEFRRVVDLAGLNKYLSLTA
jgi:anti-sigma B factor antagonist